MVDKASPQLPWSLEYKLKLRQAWRQTIVEYMRSCMEREDWHGVADAANDLRELDAEIRGLTA